MICAWQGWQHTLPPWCEGSHPSQASPDVLRSDQLVVCRKMNEVPGEAKAAVRVAASLSKGKSFSLEDARFDPLCYAIKQSFTRKTFCSRISPTLKIETEALISSEEQGTTWGFFKPPVQLLSPIGNFIVGVKLQV